MKRIRLVSIAVAVIVLGGLAIAIFRGREPHYQGRTLSEWIEADMNSDITQVEHNKARYAVKQMASGAVPLLLNWAQARDSSMKDKLGSWLAIHSSIHFKIRTIDSYHMMALSGFDLLEGEAKPAWPTLIEMTRSSDSMQRYWGLYCLTVTMPDRETFIPVLLRLTHDSDMNVQFTASRILHKHYPEEAEAAGVYKIFPQIRHYVTERPKTNQSRAK